jgi:hypothetical protein
MGVGVRVDQTHVVHETIDGETILIHLGTGTYYSLEGVGSEVWQLLATGRTLASVLALARDRYLGDPLEIELGLSGLVQELIREELLVENDVGERPDDCGLPAGQVEFAAPVLQAYTDMQQFMLVDPLHDVDESSGWPHARAG